MMISSRSNARVHLAKQLHRRKGRQREGRWLVEGVRALEEALRHGRRIETLFYSAKAVEAERVRQLIAQATEKGTAVYELTDELMDEVSDAQTPQGVVGIVPAPPMDVDLFAHPSPWILVVDRIQDPGNLGTLCRTALAAAVTGVALLPGTVDPGNPKVIRSSAGALFGLDFLQCSSGRLIEEARRSNVQLVTADLTGTTSLYDVDWTRPTALIVGNEAGGPAPEIKCASDLLVRIPMPGPVESLNVATATALCLYEGVRQRMGR